MSDTYLDSLGLITDRTSADVRAKNARGTYNATDMNRVVAAVEYLRPMFREYGYSVGDAATKEWATNRLVQKSECADYLRAVTVLRGHFRYPVPEIELPETMERLTFVGANNIERFLSSVSDAFELMRGGWYYSGEIYCNEV